MQKALRRSFLEAIQTIAWECHKELVAKSNVPYFLGKRIINPPQNRLDIQRLDHNIQWLDQKIKQLARKLKEVERSHEMPLESLAAIESLLTPKGQLAEERIQVVREKLVAEALKDDPRPPMNIEAS